MTVLENIFIGRHHLLKNNFLKGSFLLDSRRAKRRSKNRIEAERILDFLEISDIRKTIAGTLSYGLRKRVELSKSNCYKP